MHQAALNDDHVTLIRMIETQPELIGQTQNGYTALQLAAVNNKLNAIQVLMKVESGLFAKNGLTSLMLAISKFNKQAAIILSEVECGIVSKTTGETALIIACFTRQPDLIPYLLKETGIQNFQGTSALMTCVRMDVKEGFELLKSEQGLQDSAGKTALMTAVRHWRDSFYSLQEYRKQDENGHTALMLAVTYKNIPAIKFLLQYEQFMQNKVGESALIMAIKYNQPDCCILLKEEQQIRDFFGLTAVMHAAYDDRVLILKTLSDSHNLRSLAPSPDLHITQPECLSSIQRLQQRNNFTGATPLMFACYSGALKSVSHLKHQELILDSNNNNALIYSLLNTQQNENTDFAHSITKILKRELQQKTGKTGSTPFNFCLENKLYKIAKEFADFERELIFQQKRIELGFVFDKILFNKPINQDKKRYLVERDDNGLRICDAVGVQLEEYVRIMQDENEQVELLRRFDF
ncbi:Ankyrin_repeat protein 2 [Hexamita inflata]|uniref:Ankyrin repeat protein 2 n=1 Tax=Hexamita inflata TaxID=28002 RepID=A0AA86PGL4_9EUKA|nr:Ankyrin repeat protein 2 [Hexamita inflata]